jgi:AcrR family transcriptional regulator
MGSLNSSFATSAKNINDSTTASLVRRTALQLFVSNGFQSVSLRQLAEGVGIQAGSLYNHIESKQALLFDFIEELDSLLLHVTVKGFRRRMEAQDAVRLFIKNYMKLVLENRALYILSRREICNLSGEQQNYINCIRVELLDALSEIICRGRLKGEFAVKDDRLTASTICATLDGALGLNWVFEINSQALITQIQSFVLQAILNK